MRVDFTQVLLDTKGQPIKEDGSAKDLTLQTVAETALLAVFRDEAESMQSGQKVALFKLALRCVDVADLKVEDVAVIKTRIGKSFGPLIVGRAFELIEPELSVVEEEESA